MNILTLYITIRFRHNDTALILVTNLYVDIAQVYIIQTSLICRYSYINL